jgi:hydrogenase nickel incorporation protein HypA/HybF
MHEVSLMQNLLDVVSATARREKAEHVDLIHLRIGEMAGVNVESLAFAFEILSKGTEAEGGRLECETVALRARCSSCGADFRPEELVFRCPACRSAEIELTAGREMEIDYILLDEREGPEPGNGS